MVGEKGSPQRRVIAFLAGLTVVGGFLWFSFGVAASLWFVVGYLVGVGCGVYSCIEQVARSNFQRLAAEAYADAVTGQTPESKEKAKAEFLRAQRAKPNKENRREAD
jgi:hypothetical protein